MSEKSRIFAVGNKRYIMNTATYNSNAVMGNLWSYIQGLYLSEKERIWLADRLLEDTHEGKPKMAKKKLVFPHINEDFQPSEKVLSMSCGPLPEGFDIDKELEKMWEERAK